MSRYQVSVAEWPDEIVLIVGWDPGLNTYFSQIYRGNPFDENSECLLWIGTDDVISTVDALIDRLNVNLAPGILSVVIPGDIQKQLQEDRQNNSI